MRRDEVQHAVIAKLRELGVPTHVFTVRKIPSSTECNVLIGKDAKKLTLRSGITRPELNEHLRQLEAWWTDRQGQVDLEEAIGEQPDPGSAIEQATCR